MSAWALSTLGLGKPSGGAHEGTRLSLVELPGHKSPQIGRVSKRLSEARPAPQRPGKGGREGLRERGRGRRCRPLERAPGEAGVKSRISMRAGLMQITAIGSSSRKAKQLQPGLPSSALQPGEA